VNAAAILEHDNVRGFANANHKTGRRFRILDYTLAACSGRIILQPESDDVIFKDEIAERIVDASILANSVRMYNVLLNLRVLLVDYRVIISLVLRKDAARDPDAGSGIPDMEVRSPLRRVWPRNKIVLVAIIILPFYAKRRASRFLGKSASAKL
jgi:hypothetical protein